MARNLKKEGKIHAAWTDVGKMKVREGDQTRVIRSLEDLYTAVDPGHRANATPAASSNADREGFRPVPGRGRSGLRSSGSVH